MEKQQQKQFIGQFKINNNVTLYKNYIETLTPNIRLYFNKYSPVNAQATIVIIHGLGQHSGRFQHIAQYFASQNLEVLLIDLRGFGVSGGSRGCSLIQQLHQDVSVIINHAKKDLPLFLYAHSLGALIVLSYLIINPSLNISGVIITSPLLGLNKDRKINFVKRQMLNIFGNQLQDFVINSQINPTSLTKKNKQIKNIFKDRLMIPFLGQYFKIRIGMAMSIILTIEFMKRNISKFDKTILLFHGTKDVVTNVEDTIYFFNNISTLKEKKNIKLFQNGLHQLQHDQQCDQLLKISKNWIKNVKNKYPLGYLTQSGQFDINSMNHGIPQTKSCKFIKVFIFIIFILILLLFKNKYKNTLILKTYKFIQSLNIFFRK